MCYYPENKSKIALSLSLTGIEHFHAEVPKTNICCVTQRLSVGMIQARCSSCLLYNNFRIICRSLSLFACFDRKVSAFFFSITTCKSTSLSIECRRRLIAWLVKFIKNEPAVFWPVGFLQISLNEKIPGHSQLFSWAKTIDIKESEMQRPQFFFKLNSHCTLSCSLRLNFPRSLLIFCLFRSVSTSKVKSSTSASSSSFILKEGDFVNKPIFVTADDHLKYRAICFFSWLYNFILSPVCWWYFLLI